MDISVDDSVLVTKDYFDLPRISDCYLYQEINYDFYQHDNGDVFFLCGWADSAKGMASEPGRVWAVLPDEEILRLAFIKIPPEKFIAYTARTFKGMHDNFPKDNN